MLKTTFSLWVTFQMIMAIKMDHEQPSLPYLFFGLDYYGLRVWSKEVLEVSTGDDFTTTWCTPTRQPVSEGEVRLALRRAKPASYCHWLKNQVLCSEEARRVMK